MSGWGRLQERVLGYRPVGRWRLYRIDPEARRRGSLPERVAVPSAEARAWRKAAAAERFTLARLAAYAADFVAEHPRHPWAAPLAKLAAKAPLAIRAEGDLRERRWSEAAPALRDLLAIDPEDARARFLLGVCQLHAGDIAGAEASLRVAAEGMDRDADLHAALGRCREAAGDAEAARCEYRRALEREPGHQVALERLAALGDMVEVFLGTLDEPERAFLPRAEYERMIEGTWDAASPDARFLLERARFHRHAGHAGLALRAADRVLALATRSADEEAEALAHRCRALMALDRPAEAEESLRRLESIAGDSEWAASCRGHLEWARGEHEAAAASIRRALSRNANRLEDLRLWFDPRFPGRPQDPRDMFNHLLNIYPQSFAVKSLVSCSLLLADDRDRGVDLALAAARQGATHECLLDLTGALGRLGLHEAVCRLAEIAGGWQGFLRADALLRSNLAVSHEQSGHREAARALWQSVAEDATAHPGVRRRARDAARRNA